VWSRVAEKVIFAQPFENYLPCTAPRGLLLFSHGPYHESYEFSSHSYTLFISFLHLTIPRGLIPSGFLTKILYAFLICVKCSAGLIFLSSQDLITRRLFGEEDQLGSSLLCSFLHPPVQFNQILISLASFMHKLYSVKSLHNWMVSLLQTADIPSHCVDDYRMYCLKLLDYVKIHIDHVW